MRLANGLSWACSTRCQARHTTAVDRVSTERRTSTDLDTRSSTRSTKSTKWMKQHYFIDSLDPEELDRCYSTGARQVLLEHALSTPTRRIQSASTGSTGAVDRRTGAQEPVPPLPSAREPDTLSTLEARRTLSPPWPLDNSTGNSAARILDSDLSSTATRQNKHP